MTDHDLRIRLAEAQGWTDIMVPGPRPRMGEDVTGMPPEGHRPGYRTELPDPLEDDRDAALLRAWCVRQGWRVRCYHDEGATWWDVADLRCCGATAHWDSMVRAAEEPDPGHRERLALCLAVMQAIEAEVERLGGASMSGPMGGAEVTR